MIYKDRSMGQNVPEISGIHCIISCNGPDEIETTKSIRPIVFRFDIGVDGCRHSNAPYHRVSGNEYITQSGGI